MKLLFDLFPMLIFYIGFKLYDVYTATLVAMVASLGQVLFHRIKYKQYEKMHLIGLGLIMLLGSATIFFHNPWFIKCKPTAIYWITAFVFLASSLFGKKPVIQKLMEGNIRLPQKIWHRLNISWTFFFVMMGSLNLYIAYHYDTNIWVNFKLFGSLGCTTLFMIAQGIYLSQYMDNRLELEKKTQHNQP